MTSLGRTIITIGIFIFTVGSLGWIVQGDWHYFAAGAAVFFGSLLTGAVLSIETRQTSQREKNQTPPPPPSPSSPEWDQSYRNRNYNSNTDTAPLPDWTPPPSPPPDQQDGDAFFRN